MRASLFFVILFAFQLFISSPVYACSVDYSDQKYLIVEGLHLTKDPNKILIEVVPPSESSYYDNSKFVEYNVEKEIVGEVQTRQHIENIPLDSVIFNDSAIVTINNNLISILLWNFSDPNGGEIAFDQTILVTKTNITGEFQSYANYIIEEKFDLIHFLFSLDIMTGISENNKTMITFNRNNLSDWSITSFYHPWIPEVDFGDPSLDHGGITYTSRYNLIESRLNEGCFSRYDVSRIERGKITHLNQDNYVIDPRKDELISYKAELDGNNKTLLISFMNLLTEKINSIKISYDKLTNIVAPNNANLMIFAMIAVFVGILFYGLGKLYTYYSR